MSDHEQTLRDADVERLRAVARLYQTIPGMSPTRAEQDATAAACLSGADALVREKALRTAVQAVVDGAEHDRYCVEGSCDCWQSKLLAALRATREAE